VLSTELKDLELNGFVNRNVFRILEAVKYELLNMQKPWVACHKHWRMGSKAERDGEEKYA
jgi:DNA-binding HxlR family transcriptional regulator